MNEAQALSALLSIAEEMETEALDTLISAMAEVRARKQPPVAASFPTQSENPSAMNTPVTVEDSPAILAKRLNDGRIRIYARSSGFGWLAFNLHTRSAASLRDWMNANVGGISDLVGTQSGQRH